MGIQNTPWQEWGFADPSRAEACAAVLEERRPGLGVVAGQMCSVVADPDLALTLLADLAEAWDLGSMDPADQGWVRLAAVLGGSAAVGRWLKQRPGDAQVAFGDCQPWTAEAIRADILTRTDADELRWAYRRHVVRIAARDLTSEDPAGQLEAVCAELSDLADAVVVGALAIAAAMVPGQEKVRLGVVALGKTGAREANYLSDVDVLYVAEPTIVDGEPACSSPEAMRIATQLAAKTGAICSDFTAAGTIFPIDANLRPEGGAGPLVRTLAGMRAYYTTWAKNWEFQAMLKARPMAGDLALAQEFVDMVSPLVWNAAERDGFVAETQAMRARVVSLIQPAQASREIKLSSGGLRDTEFSVQMLQLVHGRSDERLRVPATLAGLSRLVAYGYVGRKDGAELDQAYRFQRLLEHRIQLSTMRRTHLMPTDDHALRRLARSVGMSEASQVVDAWQASAATVRRLHRRLYYSPLLEAVASIPTDAVRLTTEAATIRLRALGYADATAALRHIEALTQPTNQGTTRRAEILHQLLPVMLDWIASGPNPDAGLLAFRQMAEALVSSPFFLRALRDEGLMARHLAQILSTSRYASALLQRSPGNVAILAQVEESGLPTSSQVAGYMNEALSRQEAIPQMAEAIRSTRQRELLRIAATDIVGNLGISTIQARLSDLTSATIDAALSLAKRDIEDPPEMAVIAMGSWGGREMSYGSDADMIVVVADGLQAPDLNKAVQILQMVTRLLIVPGPDPALDIDLDLRPEGKDGALVRTVSSYQAYYEKWSSSWEAQALLKARFGAGSADLAQTFLSRVAEVRYPVNGLTPAHLTQIRRLKARMETERIGRGIDPKDHLKLGPGGLSDVEWTVQLLQLQHGAHVPQLQTTGTLDALDQATRAGLLDLDDADALRDAFLLANRIRTTITLLRNKASSVIPADASDLGQVAEIMGYTRGAGSHLADDWYRLARRAKAVTDKIFWGD